MNRRDNREHGGRDEFEERDEASGLEVEDADDPLQKVDQLLAMAADRDPARPLLYQLRRQLMEREISFQEARRSLVEMEAALEKVTAPANRIGIFLGSPKEGIANVFVSGSEYYANRSARRCRSPARWLSRFDQ